MSALGLVTFILALRALQVQVVQRDDWQSEAISQSTKPEMLSTTRGNLLDYKGRVIAEDESCFDACVDYDALSDVPDPLWLKQTALARLTARGETKGLSKSARADLLAAEQQQVLTDLDTTWKILSHSGDLTLDEIDDLRHSIIQRVESRGHSVANVRYAAAVKKLKDQPATHWYERIFNDSEGEQVNRDDYQVDLAEAHEPHPILRAIDNDTRNKLSLLGDNFIWLKVLPSVRRVYPYHDVAAQLIGRESAVTRELIHSDPFKDDLLRKYSPSDLVGTSGLEALCEPLLRGSRGEIDRRYGETTVEVSNTQPKPGQDVRATIDIELQQDIQEAFKHIQFPWSNERDDKDLLSMPGAAVVIDIPTGEVRALASMPTYDLNDFDAEYPKLVLDAINRPLMNRATQMAVEPGSTVKPMIGLGAITSGVSGINDTIECTGYLVIGGHRVSSTAYRCWTVKMHTNAAAHHNTWPDPHPTGFLTFADALERSCNVFFETTANRLGPERLVDWLQQFGLGRPTGLGVAESSGQVPDFTGSMDKDTYLGVLSGERALVKAKSGRHRFRSPMKRPRSLAAESGSGRGS